MQEMNWNEQWLLSFAGPLWQCYLLQAHFDFTLEYIMIQWEPYKLMWNPNQNMYVCENKWDRI